MNATPTTIDYEAEAALHATRAASGDLTINLVMEAQLAFTFAALALVETLKGSEEST